MSRPIATIHAQLATKNPKVVEAFNSRPDRFVLRRSESTGNIFVFSADTYVPREERADGKAHSSEQTSECTGSLHMSVEPARKIYRDPSPEASPIVRRFADYRDPRHRERAAATICERAKAAGAVSYFCSIKITPEHWQVARLIGEARMRIAILNGRSDRKAREWDNESEAALAELVVSRLLSGGDVYRAPLVLDEADDGVDLQFPDGTRADIKAINAAHDAAFINNSAHERKRPNFYVLAHVFSEIVDLFLVNAAAVDSWELCKRRNGRPLPLSEWSRKGFLFAPTKPQEVTRDTATEIAEAFAILASCYTERRKGRGRTSRQVGA